MMRGARSDVGRGTMLRTAYVAAAMLLVASGCGIGRATRPDPAAPVPAVPSPVERTPTVTMPPATVTRAPTAAERLRYLADSVRTAPMWTPARWGMLVVDAESGDTLLSHDADKLFMPASNQKLLTAAIAIEVLGGEYTWRTPVLLRGARAGSTWRGDLIIEGRGDPSWSDTLRGGDALRTFDPIVAALAQRGITRITGRVLFERDAFEGITTGYGWEVDDLDLGYGAAVDEVLFNEGAFRLQLFAGARDGAPLRTVRSPLASYPPVVMQAVTGTPTNAGERVRAEYDSVASAVVVRGALPAGDSAAFTLAYRHPADAVRAAVRQRLASAGIVVSGADAKPATRAATPAPLDTLVVLESVPMREVLARMQKPSQNQIAELLFRTSGLVGSGSGSADSARAVAQRVLATFGVGTDAVAYRDGSGMSRHDYVTPRGIVRVLGAMHRSPWFEMYRDALPVAGVDGTLANRMRGTLAQANARAKTGTVDKARSLSGYVRSADGRLLIFSLLCNNFTVPNREVERVQDMIVTMLAASRIGD